MDKKEMMTSAIKGFCSALCGYIGARVAVEVVKACENGIKKYKEFNEKSIEDMFAEE